MRRRVWSDDLGIANPLSRTNVYCLVSLQSSRSESHSAHNPWRLGMNKIARLESEPAAVDRAIADLAASFSNRLVTSQAVREQHGNTTTWIASQPPDAVLYPQTSDDVCRAARICAQHGVPIIPYGTGTSFEGHVN